MRTRRRLGDTAFNVKPQINNASCLVQTGDRLCKSVEAGEESGGFTHANRSEVLRPDSRHRAYVPPDLSS